MNDDNKDCFDNSRFFFNNVKFVTSISIYQIKLKFFFMFSIQQLFENRAQYLFIFVKINFLNIKMFLFNRNKDVI